MSLVTDNPRGVQFVDFPRAANGSVTLISVAAGLAGLGYGSWIEMVASTTKDAHGIQLWQGTAGVTATITNCVIEVGIGAAASEVAVISGLGVGNYRSSTPGGGFDRPHWLPVFIPSGSRIAIRLAAVEASKSVSFAVDTWRCPTEPVPYPLGKVDALGLTVATICGGPVCISGSSGAYTATPVEIVASTSFPYAALLLCVQSNDTALSSSTTRVRLLAGAGGSEVVIYDHFVFSSSNTEVFTPKHHWYWVPPTAIPAGTRLSVTASSSGTAADEIRYHLLGWRG